MKILAQYEFSNFSIEILLLLKNNGHAKLCTFYGTIISGRIDDFTSSMKGAL